MEDASHTSIQMERLQPLHSKMALERQEISWWVQKVHIPKFEIFFSGRRRQP